MFAFIMHTIFYVPMRRVIQERDDYNNTNLDEAKKLNENAEKILSDYFQRINKARLSAQELMLNIEKTAKSAKADIVADASGKSQEQINQAKETISNEKNQAIDALRAEVAPLAQQIASRVLGTEVAISGFDNEKVNNILKG
jgi:F-type H+-transporting ATPase subunit b